MEKFAWILPWTLKGVELGWNVKVGNFVLAVESMGETVRVTMETDHPEAQEVARQWCEYDEEKREYVVDLSNPECCARAGRKYVRKALDDMKSSLEQLGIELDVKDGPVQISDDEVVDILFGRRTPKEKEV